MSRKKKIVVDRWLRLYKGFTMETAATRKGSLDMLKHPSKMGKWLFYPNGEVRDVDRTDRNN